jgi:cell division septation protein DedD
MWKLILAAAMLAASAPTAAQSVETGIAAWQRGDYPGAVRIWRPLAESGDADAAFNLGQAYRLGRGVPVNLAAAQTWFERGARKGHLDAQTTLGLLLFDSGNRQTGLQWLKAAADKGEPRALLVYGTALFNGDGVTEDRMLAYAYVSRAAAQGLAAAKATLAEMDQIIPLDVRQKGVAIALAKAAPARRPPQEAARVKVSPPKAGPKVDVKTKAAAVVPVATAASAKGVWRVQLGAFSKRSSAEALFAKLSGNRALAGRRSFLIAAGAVTRLQAGPFESRAAAAAACASLSAVGQPCFSVAAR